MPSCAHYGSDRTTHTDRHNQKSQPCFPVEPHCPSDLLGVIDQNLEEIGGTSNSYMGHDEDDLRRGAELSCLDDDDEWNERTGEGSDQSKGETRL